MSTSTWTYRDGTLAWQHPNDCSQEPLGLLALNDAPMTWEEALVRSRRWYARRDYRRDSRGWERVYWWPVERYPAA
jgi:hypothetical protein